ncbi:MAG: hypothetical protein K5907_05705 [Treponema sp.]|nr:hypothetical protein [Treponema sp.]
MKNKTKLSFIAAFFLITATGLCFTGCTSEISLELKKDGSVEAVFNGVAGKAFAALIGPALGTEDAQTVIFDTKQIEEEMTQSGFSSVKAVSKNGADISVNALDKKSKSVLFSSGIVSVEKGKLHAVLTPEKLLSFYANADSQTVQFMDMLLAPVFNDEKMSEEEYLEVLTAFYGEEITQEIKESNFMITLKNPDGTKTVQSIGITKLLTLDETIEIK